jgi:O-antigen/teichoic acid export membrane protein
MASLITSGGFVQMISRRGAFYAGLKDPVQGNRVCIPILWMGIVTSIFSAVVGIFFGFYQAIAADEYIIIAGIYYTILSVVWMLFATASGQIKKIGGRVLIGITILFVILRVAFNLGAIESQIAVMTVALLILAIAVIVNTIKNRPPQPKFGKIVPLPSLSSLIYLLAPHFCYGVVYFSFIFADRLAASIANSRSYSIIKASNLDYQDDIDIALLNLLLLVPLIEYFSYKFITYWYQETKNSHVKEVQNLSVKIERRYRSLLRRALISFAGLIPIALTLLSLLNRNLVDSTVTIVGCFGYACFAIGLFNSIVLLSLDRLKDVLKSLIPGTIINFLLSYILSNLFGVYFSVIGLVVGAVCFAFLSRKRLLKLTKQPDYCYFFSGY